MNSVYFARYWKDISYDLDKARNTAERIVFLRMQFSRWDQQKLFYPQNSDLIEFVETLREEVEKYESILELEKHSVAIFISPEGPKQPEKIDTMDMEAAKTESNEQIRAHNRVANIMEKHPFWSGSLSDFVYVIDRLAFNGYLKTNELEKTLSETFSHKPEGKKEVRKLTAEKIKTRRRNMKGGRYTISSEIQRTMQVIEQNIHSKQ